MAGWISLHRKLMDNPIYSNANMLKLWIHCLMKASHSGHDQLVGNQMVKLEIGEFVTGRISLFEEFNRGAKPSEHVSESTLWRWLKNFEKWEMLNIKTTTKYSVVTVSNWSEHQQSEQQMNSKRTASEQQVNTINNVNNVNKENKEPTTTSTKPVDGFAEVFQTFESNLCKLSPLQRDSLGMWFDDFNQNKEIILEAVKIADDRNRKNFGFVEYLFKEWANNKLTTVEQVQSHERNKFNKTNNQAGNRGRYGSSRVEKVPEWFHKQQEKEPRAESSVDIAAEREKLIRELQQGVGN